MNGIYRGTCEEVIRREIEFDIMILKLITRKVEKFPLYGKRGRIYEENLRTRKFRAMENFHFSDPIIELENFPAGSDRNL